jgi:hypothetical protein
MNKFKKAENFFAAFLFFCLLTVSCAGGCSVYAVKWIWDAGTPLPLPCGSQNTYGEKGNCD